MATRRRKSSEALKNEFKRNFELLGILDNTKQMNETKYRKIEKVLERIEKELAKRGQKIHIDEYGNVSLITTAYS
jgi:septum formation inhibitor-activating ATPase MinD